MSQKERQQTDVNNRCWLGASDKKHTYTNEIAGSERTEENRQMFKTHTRTFAGLERASANRCKKLQSINKLAQKERQQRIQMNQTKYTHTQIAKNDLQTYRLADGCQAETKDEHVAKSRKRRDAIFTELQRIQITQKIVGRDFLTAQSDSGSWQI